MLKKINGETTDPHQSFVVIFKQGNNILQVKSIHRTTKTFDTTGLYSICIWVKTQSSFSNK